MVCLVLLSFQLAMLRLNRCRGGGTMRSLTSNPVTPTIFFVLYNPVNLAGFFYVLILPKEGQGFYENLISNRDKIENVKFSLNRCVLNKNLPNSLFINDCSPVVWFCLLSVRDEEFTQTHLEIKSNSLFSLFSISRPVDLEIKSPDVLEILKKSLIFDNK